MKKNIDLAKDSLLCALICTILIIMNSILMLSSAITMMIVIALIACFFQNKPIIRPIISSAVVVLVSFIFIDPLYVLNFILPAVVLGIVSSEILKRVKDAKLFYTILTVIYFLVNVIKDLIFAKFILNVDFMVYVMDNSIIDIPENLRQHTSLFLIIFFFVQAFISVLEVVVLQKSNKVYQKRIMPLIGASEKNKS